MLQLKNIKSGETWDVPAEGSFMGRAGAKAEIQIADPGVSKKHARIYKQGAGWFLEDVGSSNGTYIQGKRLTEPVQLNEGLVFGMSRNKFQVIAIAGANGNGHAARNAGVEDDMLFEQDLPPPDDIPPPGPPLPPPQQKHDPYAAPQSAPPQYVPPPNGQTAPPQSAPPQYAQQPPQQQQQGGYAQPPLPQGTGGDVDDAQAMTVGYFMAAIPKAVAFYIARAPLLLFNAFGTIRKSYEDQPIHPMGKAELMVYAFPAYAFSMMVGTLAAAIATLIAGHFTLPIVPLIINVVVAAVVSFIVGFFGHPVLAWFIRLLKGESDARSRTNYFLLFFTATILIAIPQGLGTALSTVTIPFVICIPPLLIMVGGLLMLLINYKWMKFFGVHKVIPIILLVLLGLTALGGIANMAGSVITSINWIINGTPGSGGGGGGDIDIGGGGDVDIDDLTIPDGIPKEAREGLELQLKGIKDMKANGVPDASIQVSINSFRESVKAFATVNTGNTGTEPDTGGTEPVKPKDKDKDKPKDPPKLASANNGAAPDIEYGEFAKKLGRIEQKIGNNPSLLKGKVRDLYGQLSAIEYEAEQEFSKKVGKDPELRKVFERDRDARVWTKGAEVVKDLADRLSIK